VLPTFTEADCESWFAQSARRAQSIDASFDVAHVDHLTFERRDGSLIVGDLGEGLDLSKDGGFFCAAGAL
jgi:hypothetical protein